MKNIFLILFILLGAKLFAQNEILEVYINEGLQNNLALKQKTFSLNKSLAALNEAKGMYLPRIDINARYTRAGGGRSFEIPVGDLVNPIYTGLNQVIGSPVYPTNIPNEQINFLRKKEHETKISLIQPIFQPQIYFNHKIKSNLSEIERAERDVFIRALVADIKSAYFSYLQTLKVVELYNKTEELLNENLRVSKSLYKNDKVTIDVVYRAETELSKLLQEKAEAEKNETLAKSYFNFLLNKDLNSDINISENIDLLDNKLEKSSDYELSAITKREEIKQLQYAVETSDNSISLSKSKFLPGVSLAVDYGYQGEEYKFNSDSDFWMASVVMQWNIFNGFSDKAKVEQSTWEKKIYETKINEVKKQIQLQVKESFENLNVAHKKIITAENQLTTAKKSFEIVSKKFKEGMAAQIEFIDARTSLTQAEINYLVTKYDLLKNNAEFEKVTASYPVEKINY